MRAVVCLVTGGAGRAAEGADATVARVAEAARAGVDLVQLRERELEARDLTMLAVRCVEAVRGTTTRVLINERLDVALAAEAHGVHLRADSMPASRIRSMVPASFLIGRSVHSREDAIRATADGGLSYLLYGTVFDTPSKPGRSGAGASALAGVVAATSLPVLAIGGMAPATLPSVANAGAAGFAAIGLFADPALDRLRAVVRDARLAFDSSGSVP